MLRNGRGGGLAKNWTQLQDNRGTNVIVSVLTEEAPSYTVCNTHPSKPMQGFEGFDTIIQYTAIGFLGRVAFRSIINN